MKSNLLYRVINWMAILLFFSFRVTNSKLKKKKFHFELLTRCVHFYFLTFEYECEVDKLKKFFKYYNFRMTWTASFYYIFLYLACFFVSTYVIFIWVIWILMAYVQQQMASSTTYLFTRLQKTFSSCEPKEEWPDSGFHMKWFNGR